MWRSILGSLLILWMAPASAEPTPTAILPEPMVAKANYHFTWNGLIIGTLALDAEQTDDRYFIHTDVNTAGLIRLFAKHTSHTHARGEYSAARLAPAQYETIYSTRKKTKHITLDYDATGDIHESYLPESKRAPGEEVSAVRKKGALDPISGTLYMRRALFQDEKNFTFPLYDGYRLSALHVEVIDKNPITMRGKKMPAIHVALSRTPVAGWSGKELNEYKAHGEPKLHLYFSNDAAMLPLMLTIDLDFGHVYGFLVKQCKVEEKCED